MRWRRCSASRACSTASPSALSGGQRQRVAMGRALVREPRAFLMDEPLSNLDAKLRTSMRGELARLHERLPTTTLYVTHDQVEAMTLGQRVAVIRDGVVQQCDVPQRPLRPAGQPVRRRLHRLAGDEPGPGAAGGRAGHVRRRALRIDGLGGHPAGTSRSGSGRPASSSPTPGPTRPGRGCGPRSTWSSSSAPSPTCCSRSTRPRSRPRRSRPRSAARAAPTRAGCWSTTIAPASAPGSTAAVPTGRGEVGRARDRPGAALRVRARDRHGPGARADGEERRVSTFAEAEHRAGDVGLTVDDLETPAAVIDLDRLDRNLERVAGYAAEHELALYPHTKTHKTLEIARAAARARRARADRREVGGGRGLRRARRAAARPLPGRRCGEGRADRRARRAGAGNGRGRLVRGRGAAGARPDRERRPRRGADRDRRRPAADRRRARGRGTARGRDRGSRRRSRGRGDQLLSRPSAPRRGRDPDRPGGGRPGPAHGPRRPRSAGDRLPANLGRVDRDAVRERTGRR